LVFIDEDADHEPTGYQKHGWSACGTTSIEVSRFHRCKVGYPASIDDRWIYLTNRRSRRIDNELFADWLEFQLLPHCIAWDKETTPERSVIVLNNCRIHKSPRMVEIYLEPGVRQDLLPPYSPQCNPSKLDFSVLKAGIRKDFEEAGTYLTLDMFL